MNFKLVAVASVAFGIALAAGCAQPGLPNLSGGSGGSGASDGVGGGFVTDGPTSGSSMSTASGTEDSPAKKFFNTSVFPLLVSSNDPAHSCTACHATGASNAPTFMAMDANSCYTNMDLYTGLIVAPADSQLLLHGQHTGPAMSQTQKNTVTQWLTMEAAERGLGGEAGGGGGGGGSGDGGTTMTLDEWLTMVGKCMDINDWKQYNMDLLSKAQTFKEGPCSGCHSAGEGGNYLDTLDPTTTFDMQKQLPYVKRWFKPDYANGKVSGLLPNPRQYQKGEELGQAACDPKKDIVCHPTYLLDPTLKAGVDGFISATLTRMKNNQCGP